MVSVLSKDEEWALELLKFHPVPPDEDFDPEQLATGIQIEYEHTYNREVAKLIAKHHLMESPYYYVFLLEMEEALQEFDYERAEYQSVS